jgi:hypothetical protein
MPNKQDSLARRGLTLSRQVLRRLNAVGIFAQSRVSLEHQHLANRYVVRGIESGGAVKDLGRYVTFCGPEGEPLPYLHPIDAIGVNGVHAVVIAPIFVRIEIFEHVAPANYSSRSMNPQWPNMADGLRWRTKFSFVG